MKVNLTLVLLVGIIGYAGWTFLKTRLDNAQPGNPAADPKGGKTTNVVDNVANTASHVADAITSIFNSVGTIAQTTPKQH